MRLQQIHLAVKLLAAAGAAVLASCASTPAATSSYAVDYAQVARIEHVNRVQGSQVLWVNYPLKRIDATK